VASHFLLIICGEFVTIVGMSRFIALAFTACLTIVHIAEGGETVIPFNSSWKYLKGITEASSPVSAWRALSFNDTTWESGAAPFYYGEPLSGTLIDDMTNAVNGYRCVFTRKTFDIADPGALAGFKLNIHIDDGFIAWINGTEVFRYNVPIGEPTRLTLASLAIEPQFQLRVLTNLSMLLPGQNVLAIQAFNSAANSSDLVLDAELTAFAPDNIAPVIASVTPTPGTTLDRLTQITVTFSEPVSGVEAGSLLLNGNTPSAVSGQGTTYTFTFPQPPYGPLQVSWSDQHGIYDQALFGNRFDHTAAGASWQYTLADETAPTIATLFPPAGATVRNLSQIEVTFSEDVVGVDAADLRMNGVSATNVISAGGGLLIFQFPPPSAGAVEVTWVADPAITDLAQPPHPFVPVSWSYQLDPQAPAGDLVITEILAANQSGLLDEDGDQEDWIEIYNRGSNPVNLAGWSLSDDPEESGRWVFGSGTIAPGAYLVVFASGKDRRSPTGTNPFHTNFRLANGGEFLGLYSADSPRVLTSGFAPAFPEQRNDHSYGYAADGALRYFASPSPGAANGASTIVSITEPVRFSVERGFYSNAFDLYLSSPTVGATIRYTLDGLEPSASAGIAYSGPLRITNSAMVRAVALRPHFLPSKVSTHSYLFNFTAPRRALPVINLVMPLSNWYGRSGILGMAGGSRAGDGLYITNNPATDYHNPSAHGIAWERPVSAEYIVPEDNSGFQIDCGIRVQGSDWQRPRTTENSKFSYRLYFRGDYGQGNLDYQLFPLSKVESYDQVVLRAGFNEQVNPFIRDEIIRRLSQDMGQVASIGGLALVLRNGGIYTNNLGLLPVYNPCERIHEAHLQRHFGGGPEWDVVGPDFAQSAEGPGIIDGDRIDFRNLLTNVWTGSLRPLTNRAAYQTVARRLDLVNFVDYCLLNAYTAMGDWPANNWRAARERKPNAIWRFFVWDAEWGMGIYALAVTRDSFAFTGTGTEDAGLGSTGNSEIARLYQGLRANPEFRLLWADRIQKHFFNGGALTGLNISNRFNELGAQLVPAFSPAQSMDTEILQWARDRLTIVMGQFNSNGLFGYSNAFYGIFASSNAPAFNQHGGRVAIGFSLSMSAPLGGTIYYTTNGDDPRVPFTGSVSNSAVAYSEPFQINQTTVVKARTLLDGTNWSALAEAEFKVDSLIVPLRITEIMYNPIGGSAYEFIELENYGGTPLNLAGVSFDGINFTFPAGTTLASGARVVLASDDNPPSFATRYPGVTVAGYFGGALNNAGEKIVLLDALKNTILSVSYGNGGLWPTTANGGGYSLVLVNASGDPDDPLNWSASAAQGGSPGQGDTFPAPPTTVALSEISAASAPQWIELHNPTAAAINLAGYSLTDDGNARKYVLPSLIIGADQYLAVEPPTNFMVLSPRGDEVLLYDPNTNLISKTSFGLLPGAYTFSHVGGDWTLGNPTPNAANVAASLGPATGLVINEWLANALTSEDDWVELWNNSAQSVALQGIYLGISNGLFRISSRSFIGPYGFAQLFADEDPGPDHLDFRLLAAGGRIAVYDYLGVEVNRVTYGAQAENISQGRLPDGSATIQAFPGSSSPGASNYVIVYTGAYINEVMARNVSATTNPAGRVADWIEIFNPGGSSFDLSGMSLSVDAPEPFQWVFPADSVVPPSGYLVVWCDGESPASTAFEPTLNCGQSLKGESGGVYLFSAAGQLVNFIEYGFQLANQSIGRVGAQVRLLQAFTPGAANAAAATLGSASTVTFNEWMADPARGDDWFELYNSAALPVDLGGLALTDDLSLAGQGKFRIVPLSFIGPRGWVRFQADGNPVNGFDHVNFSLNADGESLRLYTVINGTNYFLVTSVYFGPQARDITEGRLPDGGAAITRFPGSATPGESNYQLPGNVVINEVQPSTRRIELYNPSASLANVGGWYLSNSRLDYKLYRIPDGISVPAGGYTILTPTTFTLSPAAGGEVIVAVADGAGNLNGQRVQETFGPQDSGVSFGRFATSQGAEFVALAQPSLGAANGPALVGPVVISEIMYNPPPDGIEYVELHNISANGQSLAGWMLDNGVRISLPELILSAGEFLALEILPEHGRLDNDGERIDLLKPGGILVDSVDYGDSTPWPSGAVDGEGLSLQRRDSTLYGNDPLNWLASEPTPDAANGPGAVPLPVITAPPQSVSALADSIVTLSVEASGGAPLGYQWRFNGIQLPGATSRELTLNYAQSEHSGTYDVLVSNPAGAALSAPADVVINTPPIIVMAPQSQTIDTNASATLTVVVRGSAPISYQWRLNGALIPGATMSSHTINNVDLEDMGEYSVLVSNPFGSAIASAELLVRVPPRFLFQPLSQTVVEGDDATFRTAVVGMPPLGFRWRRLGAAIITNAIGFNTPIITFTNVRVNYTNIFCIATNPARFAGFGSSNANLVVLADSDQDRLPDVWEIENNVGDPLDDPDEDGFTNRQEYLAGTDPNDDTSFLRIEDISANFAMPAVLLGFNAASNKTYTVRYRNTLSGGDWTKLLDVEGALTNRFIEISDQSPNASSRFYQLLTPALR
jgi:hypothetical protein